MQIDNLGYCCLELINGRWWCRRCDPEKQRLLPESVHRNCHNCPESVDRVGDVLHGLLLTRLGVGLTSGCGCAKQIALMNAWGPNGCRENLNKIVGAMLSEAQRRNWKLDRRPLLSVVARVGAHVPWGRAYARAWARSLVLEAIRQCSV